MKNLTLSQKTSLLTFVHGDWSYALDCANDYQENKQLHKSVKRTKKDYTRIVDGEILKLSNVDREFEAMTDTDLFRSEMEVIDHGFATATGSNWDKMIVKFRREMYVINDRNHSVVKYNGENGFS